MCARARTNLHIKFCCERRTVPKERTLQGSRVDHSIHAQRKKKNMIVSNDVFVIVNNVVFVLISNIVFVFVSTVVFVILINP